VRVGRWLAVLLTLLLCACARPGGEQSDVRRITIVDFSDWHGQLEPVPVTVGGVTRLLGGAAFLKAYFDRERSANPGGTLVVTAGDAFGATPPVSSFLDDVPAVEAQNLMGVDVDTFGNHNFDHGIPRLEKLRALARFPYVAANIVGPDGRTVAPPSHAFTRNGVRIGVIGVAHPETPVLVKPERVGNYRFLPPAPAINRHAEELRRQGAQLVVVLAHIGASGVMPDGTPLGPLAELARAVRGVDVLIGDHTDVSVNAVVGDVLVVESRSKGIEYAVIDIEYDLARRTLVRKTAEHKRPYADAVTPDPALSVLVAGYLAQARPLFDRVVGQAAVVLERSRSGESALGNFVADAMRAEYGTQLAFTVSGGLRDDLPSSYRPAPRELRRPVPEYSGGPPWDLVRGDFFAVFPFGNVAVTFEISGRTLWSALENSVSQGVVVDGRFTNEAGRFLQISGFSFRFDPRQPAGRRVTSVTAADGTAIPPDDRQWTAVTLDFAFAGGDAYTMLNNGTGTTREPIAEIIARAVSQPRGAAARVEGRIGISGP
jgi:5'-nucleotidase